MTTILFEDNQSFIALVNVSKLHPRTKFIEVKYTIMRKRNCIIEVIEPLDEGVYNITLQL